jgi:hypothetical protein
MLGTIYIPLLLLPLFAQTSMPTFTCEKIDEPPPPKIKEIRICSNFQNTDLQIEADVDPNDFKKELETAITDQVLIPNKNDIQTLANIVYAPFRIRTTNNPFFVIYDLKLDATNNTAITISGGIYNQSEKFITEVHFRGFKTKIESHWKPDSDKKLAHVDISSETSIKISDLTVDICQQRLDVKVSTKGTVKLFDRKLEIPFDSTTTFFEFNKICSSLNGFYGKISDVTFKKKNERMGTAIITIK